MSTLLDFVDAAETNAEINEEFKSVSTVEDIQQLAAKHGYELSGDDVADLQEVAKNMETGETELSDDQLEQVSGGGIFGGVLVVFAAAVIGYFAKKGYDKARDIQQRREERLREAGR